MEGAQMSGNKRARSNRTHGINDAYLKSLNRLTHTAVDPQGLLTRDLVLRHIEAGTCPICGAGPYKVLPVHTNKMHGIDKFELRDMAGLTSSQPVSSAEFRERASQIARERDIGHTIGQDRIGRSYPPTEKRRWTAAGRNSVGKAGMEAIHSLPLEVRQEHARLASKALTDEGRKRKSKITSERNASPEWKAKFVELTQTPEVKAKRVAAKLQGHGTRASYRRGCRCPDCTSANTASKKRKPTPQGDDQ